MPVPGTNAPYDLVNDALNAARQRLNDAIASIVPTGGKILQDNEAFTQVAVNNAWRNMQKILANLGWSRLKNETVFSALPACSSVDPIVQVRLNWDNYFNGATQNTGFFLPLDFIQPESLWERITGAVVPNFYTMDRI